MDVDTMSTEKRTYLMRKGPCFICEGVKHRASDHKLGGSHYEEKKKGKFVPQKKRSNIKDIHTLLQGLTKEEKQELVDMQLSGVVFAGPVAWTENATGTGPNTTDCNWTAVASCLLFERTKKMV
jgi:hypothetical protein